MKTALPALLFLALLGCAEPASKRYEKMAAGWCDCTAPLVELNEQAQKMMSEPLANPTEHSDPKMSEMADSVGGKQAALAQIFRKMEAAEKAANACSTILKDKYGAVKKEEWAEAEPFFWKKCPKMVGQGEKLRGMLGE